MIKFKKIRQLFKKTTFTFIIFSAYFMAFKCDNKSTQKLTANKVVIVNKENFDETIKSEKLLLIYFYADWCKYCTKFTPIVEEISNENTFVVGKIDVDLAPEIFQTYKDKYIPMIIIFKNGEVQDKIVGTTPKEAILERVNIYI